MATAAAVVPPASTEITPATTEPTKPAGAPAEAAPATEVTQPTGDEPVGDAVDDSQDEDFPSVSKEELQAIKADPRLSKLLKGMNKGNELRREAVAQERARHQADLELIAGIRDNPMEAARIIAEAAGADVVARSKPATPQVDALVERLAAVVGPDIAKAFKPILDDAIDQRVAEKIAPYKAETETIAAANMQARSESEVEQFKARHPGQVTTAIETKMVELSKKYGAGEDVDPQEYMEGLFVMATAGKTKSDVVKETAARMKAAADGQEPRTTVAPTNVTPAFETKGKSFDEAFDSAWKVARQRSATS